MLSFDLVVRRFRGDVEQVLSALDVPWRWGSEPRLSCNRPSGRGVLVLDVIVEQGIPGVVGNVLKAMPQVVSLELCRNTITLAFDPTG